MDRLARSSGTLILVDDAERTSSGDSGPITGLGGMTALKAQLNVTDVSGLPTRPQEFTPRLTVVVEETLDGTNWNQIGDFLDPPTPTFPNGEPMGAVGSRTITLDGPLAETIRVGWTITGTSPLFRFSVTSPPCQPGA